MKLSLIIIFITISGISYSKELDIRPFEKKELPIGQSGCWYYQPVEEKQRGKVVAVGESEDEVINFVINDKKVSVGGWKNDYQESYDYITYNNDFYLVSIKSKIISESRHSSQFNSKITISNKDNSKTIEVFGECGS